MSWKRAKSPGWAAFDLQQKPKQVLEPFPSLPSSDPSLRPCTSRVKNDHFSESSYASAALPNVRFPACVKDKKASISSEASDSSRHFGNNNFQEKGYDSVFRQLKVLYSWADDSLIEDILAAVDNNFEQASSSLKAMVSDDCLENYKGTGMTVSGPNLKHDIPEGSTFQADKIISVKATHPAELSPNLESSVGDHNKNMIKDNYFCDEKLDDFSSSMAFVPAQLPSAPIEPEWEDDDVYLSHRRDAIKIIRAAARHSKAAANSFSRGDHYSAQHCSQKAREEWEAAEKLNQKAADEILSMRNNRNGMWRLDLHGLHAVEAVQALRERLNMIETEVVFNGPAFPGCSEGQTEAQHDTPSLRVNEMKSPLEQPLIRQRPVSLEVITGIGNHSRGEAAIPAAVRSFLIDNGYRHDEARPGMIMVRPKFRRR